MENPKMIDFSALRALGPITGQPITPKQEEEPLDMELIDAEERIRFDAFKGRERRQKEAVEWFTPLFRGKYTSIEAVADSEDACFVIVSTPDGVEMYYVPDAHEEALVRRLVMRPTSYQIS